MSNVKLNFTRDNIINSTNNHINNSNTNYNNNITLNLTKNNTILNTRQYTNIPKFAYSYYFILGLSIIVPLLLFIIIMFIYYCIKKRMKLKNQKETFNMNKIHKEKPQNKQSYNRIMNTSGVNNLNQNTNNLSEIKVQNMKEEINNIINTSGSSSGRRKREKRKIGKKEKENNLDDFDNKEGQKEIQNEIKEQIKQFVIEEHNNNSNE